MNPQQYLYVNFIATCNSHFVPILKYSNRAVINLIELSEQCSKFAVILTILQGFWSAPAYCTNIHAF